MGKLDYIEITIFDIYNITKISISIPRLKLTINDKLKDISSDKIEKLLEIIKCWDDNYKGFMLDIEKYTIKLISKNRIIKVYKGNGKYPYNYNEFKRWISDVR